MTDTAPPQNLDVEQALLGSLLVNNDTIALVRGIVSPGHFAEPLHARIYDAVCRMHDDGTDATALTLIPRFENDATMAELGGVAYLAQLSGCAVPLNATSHARQIRELADRRTLIVEGERLAEDAADTSDNGDYRKSAAEHVSAVSDMLEGSTQRKHSFTLGEAADVVCERLDRMAAGEADPNAISTGIPVLDEVTGGLRRGNYVILAGRPSMGKTAVGVQIALNVSKAGHGVGYFSLEMPAASLTERCMANHLWMPETQIAYVDIANGRLDERQARWVRQARDDVQALPLRIDDRPALTAAQIEAQARVWASNYQREGKKLDLVVIDHLHKCTATEYTQPVQIFTHVSARLADLSKKLDCPVLALAQLNRGVEAREDKRPTLADLRESGSIEQDADAVIFTYRESYYLERQTFKDYEDEADRLAELAHCRDRLDLLVAKNRQGPIASVDVWCDLPCNVIRDPRELHEMDMEARAA